MRRVPRWKRGRGLAGAGSVLWLLLLVAVPAAAEEPGIPGIDRFEFAGNETLSDGKLRDAMRLAQKPWWNPFRKRPYLGADILSLDLYRLLEVYRDEGFPLAMIEDAEVRLLEGEQKVRIIITVSEGPQCRIRAIELVGVLTDEHDTALNRIRLRVDDLLRQRALDRTRDVLEEFLVEAGYLGARVHADVSLQGTAADVTFRVEQGPQFRMRDVVIDKEIGRLERSKPRVVRREVALKEGKIFRRSRLLSTQDRLFETGLFRTVRVLPEPDSLGAPVADLRIVVHERNSGWYGFGAGYSSDERIRLLADWGHRNLMRMGRRLAADGDVSFTPDRTFRLQAGLLRLRYTEPWAFRTPLKSQTSVYHSYERITPVGEQTKIYDQDITALENIFSYRLGRYSRVGLGLTNKWVRTGDPTSERKRYQTRNVSATWDKDSRDSFLDPSRGQRLGVGAEYAGGLLGGQNEFSRWTVTAAWYRPLKGKILLATRTRMGLIVPVGRNDVDETDVDQIPSEERFRLGGGTSVRGYVDNSLGYIEADRSVRGGTALLLGNIELRFPILWLFKGALFLDAGNVWADYEEIKPSRFRDGLDPDRRSPLNLAYSVGGGLRFVTPVGPFRFDYGYRLGRGQGTDSRRDGIHLSLGQAF